MATPLDVWADTDVGGVVEEAVPIAEGDNDGAAPAPGLSKVTCPDAWRRRPGTTMIANDMNVERAVKLRELWFPGEMTAEAGRHHTSIRVSDGLRTLIAERESEVHFLRSTLVGFRDFQKELIAKLEREVGVLPAP